MVFRRVCQTGGPSHDLVWQLSGSKSLVTPAVVSNEPSRFIGGLEVQQSALPCGHEVLQPQVGDECGQDDGERRGEAFEDVVGVLDDRRDDQAAQRLVRSGKKTVG